MSSRDLKNVECKIPPSPRQRQKGERFTGANYKPTNLSPEDALTSRAIDLVCPYQYA
jgi:hypothetical protein